MNPITQRNDPRKPLGLAYYEKEWAKDEAVPGRIEAHAFACKDPVAALGDRPAILFIVGLQRTEDPAG